MSTSFGLARLHTKGGSVAAILVKRDRGIGKGVQMGACCNASCDQGVLTAGKNISAYL